MYNPVEFGPTANSAIQSTDRENQTSSESDDPLRIYNCIAISNFPSERSVVARWSLVGHSVVSITG